MPQGAHMLRMGDDDREKYQLEIERLRGAISAIQKATVEGRVCDDVAWFDAITTLYDFCDQTLNPWSHAQQKQPKEG